MTEADADGTRREPAMPYRRTSRRSLLRVAAVAGAGALYVAFVSRNPLLGLTRIAFAQPPASPGLRCLSCDASVDTRAGYIVCRSCSGHVCPRCTRLRDTTFLCRPCFESR